MLLFPLAFPCNQFGSQEPQPVERIRKEMKKQFNVDFPIFDKIDVNGGDASPLFKQLKSYDGLGMMILSFFFTLVYSMILLVSLQYDCML